LKRFLSLILAVALAAIGLTAEIGDYSLAGVVTVLVVIILSSNRLLKRIGFEKD
jgi:uncharacterized membrane protein YhiD involved in acid resistance